MLLAVTPVCYSSVREVNSRPRGGRLPGESAARSIRTCLSVLLCAGVTDTGRVGRDMDTTQRTDQERSADRRRRELLEAADRVVLRDGPGASMNAIAAE